MPDDEEITLEDAIQQKLHVRLSVMSMDWDAIKKRLAREEIYGDPLTEEGPTQLLYLGSVLSMTPSGKYYLPFAAGNVDNCPTCHGSGRSGKTEECTYCKGEGRRPRNLTIPHDPDTNPMVDCSCDHGKIHIACPVCEGYGADTPWGSSFEALLDSIWNEAMDEVAGCHGLFVQGGEGSPTDLYVGRVVSPGSVWDYEIVELDNVLSALTFFPLDPPFRKDLQGLRLSVVRREIYTPIGGDFRDLLVHELNTLAPVPSVKASFEAINVKQLPLIFLEGGFD